MISVRDEFHHKVREIKSETTSTVNKLHFGTSSENFDNKTVKFTGKGQRCPIMDVPYISNETILRIL